MLFCGTHAPGKRRLKAEQRRQLILQGAVELFAERGYEATSMADVARAAGVTPAVIYDHFPSKAALAIELLELHTRELLGFVGRALQEAPDGATEQMRAGVGAFFAYVEENRLTWRVLFRDPPVDPDVSAAYRRLNNEATAAISVFLESSDKGVLATYENPARTVELFATALKAGQNALAAWWYEHPEVPREEIVERMLEFAWVGLERIAQGEPEEQA